jgi:hypothetical protein
LLGVLFIPDIPMLKYGNVLRNVKVNVRLRGVGVDVEHSQPLNDSFSRLTSHSLETWVCLFLAETRPSHRIKINDSYREMHASNADLNLPVRWCSNYFEY